MSWKEFMDWLPDLKVGVIEIRDVLNVGVAIAFGFFAIRLGRIQTAIALKQDAIMERDRKKKPKLTMRVNLFESGIADSDPNQHFRRNRLAIINEGNKPARDIHFRVYVPHVGAHQPELTVCPGVVKLVNKNTRGEEGEWYVELRGTCPGPVYPGQWFECVLIYIQLPRSVPKAMTTCEYGLNWEDGQVPESGGLETLSLRAMVRIPAAESCDNQAASSSSSFSS